MDMFIMFTKEQCLVLVFIHVQICWSARSNGGTLHWIMDLSNTLLGNFGT